MASERTPNMTGVCYQTLYTTKTVGPTVRHFLTCQVQALLLTKVVESFGEVIEIYKDQRLEGFWIARFEKKNTLQIRLMEKNLAPLGMPQKVLILV